MERRGPILSSKHKKMSATAQQQKVELGLNVLLREKRDWIRGKSIGLITNHTGVDATLRSNYRLFAEAPSCRLSAVFSPEHGFWGAVQDGIAIDSLNVSDGNPSRRNTQAKTPDLTNVPVYSLYGQSIRPSASQLEGIDLLIYDMQDVGARYYTYISTLLHAMEAASDHGIEFVVTDRPNPITCNVVEGPVLERGFESFVGIHTVPIRYGLTIGELATLLKAERVPACRLKVAWMQGYERGMWYDDTGLQWVPPSPNMPTLTTAVLYPGLCLFEGTNMSEGRGTTNPFEYIGAPWCNGEKWAEILNALCLPGVLFRPVVFTPAPAAENTKHAKQTCSGVAIHITDREGFLPVETVIHMLSTLTTEYRNHFAFRPAHFDRLAGNSWLRDALLKEKSIDTIRAQWTEELQRWCENTKQYHAYN
ncbi:DUF1343 domain-containing protein [Candidatus Poribacteria bacterium]|nr:DUF1343 domain-containing protein [Candidatus Poribacteria bacterium]